MAPADESPRILYIDDDDGLRRLVSRALERRGFRVDVAPGGQEGAAMAGQHRYDLGCNVYITKPVNYESFADAIRQLGLFLSVIQVPDFPEA